MRYGCKVHCRLVLLAVALAACGSRRAEPIAPAATDEAQKKAYRNLAKAFGETI